MHPCIRRLLTRYLLELLEPDIRRIVRDEVPPEPPELDYDVQPLFREGPAAQGRLSA